jgi:hypothetical protein
VASAAGAVARRNKRGRQNGNWALLVVPASTLFQRQLGVRYRPKVVARLGEIRVRGQPLSPEAVTHRANGRPAEPVQRLTTQTSATPAQAAARPTIRNNCGGSATARTAACFIVSGNKA